MSETDWRMRAMADFFGAKFVRVDEDGEPMTTNDATPREADRAVPEPDAVHAVHEAIVNNAPDWIIDREDGELFDMARAALAAVPEPDADAVERAAKAIFREVVGSDWGAVGKRVKDTYRGMARAALAAAKGKEDEQEDCGCTSIDYGWYGNDGGIVNVIQCSDEGCPRANKGTEGARDGAG